MFLNLLPDEGLNIELVLSITLRRPTRVARVHFKNRTRKHAWHWSIPPGIQSYRRKAEIHAANLTVDDFVF